MPKARLAELQEVLPGGAFVFPVERADAVEGTARARGPFLLSTAVSSGPTSSRRGCALSGWLGERFSLARETQDEVSRN